MTPGSPLVTVAIPLYHSQRFLEIICANIQALPAEGIEILLSDRHGGDETLLMLQERLAGDKRLRYFQYYDRIGWVDHYNWLLQQAKGRYFMWMPHDDSFPFGYVNSLVNDLENHPDVWLSFGSILAIDEPAQTSRLMYLPQRFQRRLLRWHPLGALELLCFWNLGIPFRGVFRRQKVLERKLMIKKVNGSEAFVDQYWLFGLSLQGRLWYNPQQYCLKRYYPDNTHGGWPLKDFFVYCPQARRVVMAYIDEAPLAGSTARLLKGALLGILLVKRVYAKVFSEPVREWIRQHITGHRSESIMTRREV